ncbi:MAG: succinyldiaminopimelate transaminase [Lautropia sp.]
MNPRLSLLQPYPFERLSALLADIDPKAAAASLGRDGAMSCERFVDLSIGEPKHPSPQLVRDAIVASLDGLSAYPPTRGSVALREAIAGWIERRFGARLDPMQEVLPILGSREALFALAQVVVDPAKRPVVVSPNPFYQIYEGAAILAGARVHLVDQRPERGFLCDWASVPDAVWRETSMVYVCSPGNPTGSVMPLSDWSLLFDLSDRFGFAIASDECYSEIHFDEASPPLGGLEACRLLGRDDRRRLIVFSSLSKRSNLPGMRSGFVAGDRALIAAFLRYRTYHGSAMSPVFQAASIAAWGDEAHVVDNRRRYREKFDAVIDVLSPAVAIERPSAGFYLWLAIPDGDDPAFTHRLRAQYNCLVVPGSYLGRAASGANPGAGRVRIALVDDLASCVDGARRIRHLLTGSAG